MSDKVTRRGPWILAAIVGAGLAAGAAARLRARRAPGEADAPAEVGFMRALHAALRRDLSRLRDAAAQIDSSAGAPATVLAGWDTFRAELDNHHQAEDDDLWPVLRRELSDPGELASVDAMVEEHKHIEPALAGVDAALRGGGELAAPIETLSTVVLDHLAHEEREVLPLIEQHMTRAQWRAFMVKERNKRPPRERARVPDLGPRRRRRAGRGGRSHQAAAAGPAGLPLGAPAPLRRTAPVADPRYRGGRARHLTPWS
jgi:hypothetical protein